ncbi:MAG: metal-dependent transcriptional regulator, partial [Ktedonobacteraceae bacterium]
ACRLEHFISGAVEDRVLASLNYPTTCPHGNPIPGSVKNARTYLRDQGAVRLSTLAINVSATILLISEVVEDEEALILYLHDKGLTPGTQLTVVAQEEDKDSGHFEEENFKLLVKGREVCISKVVANKIWVRC